MNLARQWIRLSVISVSLLCSGIQTCSRNPESVSSFKRDINFNNQWSFKRCETPDDTVMAYKRIAYLDDSWEEVSLPHTARIEPLVVNDQWQGICWYRKHFAMADVYRDYKIFIEFEGAMQIADVWINGRHKTTHYGGYLPFTIDISDDVSFERENVIAVRLDNRDNPEVPPGKPLKDLDFCLFGGLYRNVRMHITDRLHITDAVYAGEVAGGGIFVSYPHADSMQAEIRVQTHLINEYGYMKTCRILTQLYNQSGQLIVEKKSESIDLNSLGDKHIVQTIAVKKPKLWHPDNPNLYELHSLILKEDQIIDKVVTRIGIKRFAINNTEGFTINGKKYYLRGTNYHQEYPYIGYALTDNAHYRDVLLIKQAGFNFVRLSHYPHAEAFMDACDELGILVLDAIPGWQFFGDTLFQQRCYQDCRDMIRRDRNHPSVVLWEVSLNESDMTREFMETAHQIAHEEYPGDQCYTCGWQDIVFDVFIPARQHAGPPDYWRTYSNKKPIMIAEYGDWEYYAHNAGFNQTDFNNLTPSERNSRQLRAFGQKRLLQQALNYQESFNDNLASPAIGCANWLIIDYNRGCADDIEASGILDIFRIPKFAYYFFKSQEAPQKSESDPTLFIADYWVENADLTVKIFSNCQRVKLSLNGEEIGIQNPDSDANSGNLHYPPFTFKVANFQSGVLEASGFINNSEVAYQKVTTPVEPQYIRLKTNIGEVKPESGQKDVFFAYASIIDKNGTVVPTSTHAVTFQISGPGRLIGSNPIDAEAGIASIIVESSGVKGVIEISANSHGLSLSKRLNILIDSVE